MQEVPLLDPVWTVRSQARNRKDFLAQEGKWAGPGHTCPRLCCVHLYWPLPACRPPCLVPRKLNCRSHLRCPFILFLEPQMSAGPGPQGHFPLHSLPQPCALLGLALGPVNSQSSAALTLQPLPARRHLCHLQSRRGSGRDCCQPCAHLCPSGWDLSAAVIRSRLPRRQL